MFLVKCDGNFKHGHEVLCMQQVKRLLLLLSLYIEINLSLHSFLIRIGEKNNLQYLFLFVRIASVRAVGAVVLRLSGVSLGQVRLSRYF